MKYLAIFSMVIGLVCCEVVYAQVQEAWVARYNGSGNSEDIAGGPGTLRGALAVDGLGNIYVTGKSIGSGTGFDYATVKYNSNGVQQWVARYDGPANSDDEARAIAVDGSGNVYVTGASTGLGTSHDYATIKYNSNGIEQWVARYNGPGNWEDYAHALAVDNSGFVYVTGGDRGSLYEGCLTIKYDANGVQVWADRYDEFWNDAGHSIAIDPVGNVCVGGESDDPSQNRRYLTIKYNANGVRQWVNLYDGPGNSNDEVRDIAIDELGNVYVTGESVGSGTNYDYTTIKYTSNGTQQWLARYNGPGNSDDRAYALAVDGDVYVTGGSIGSGTDRDYATIKYSPSGVQQWVARYNGPGDSYDFAAVLAFDGLGNVYVTGGSTGSGSSRDYATIKYNSNGVEQWVARYNGPANSDDAAQGLGVDGLGNVYVTGGSTGSGTGYDYATIKYTTSTLNQPPVANAGPDQTIPIGAGCVATVTLNGFGSSDPDRDSLTYTWSENSTVLGTGGILVVPLSLGNHTITLTVGDGRGGMHNDQIVITVVDVTPPAITCSENIFVTIPYNQTSAVVEYPAPTASDNCSVTTSCSPASGSSFAPGTTTVTCTATDPSGNTASCSFKVAVNRSPNCTATPSIAQLWPPNHRMVDISIVGVTDADGDSVTITITRITQDEPLNTVGDGNFEPDGAGVGTSAAQVRAERTGTPRVPGNGRVYQISYSASDGRGGECTGSVAVCVPHDQGNRSVCIDDGQRYNSVTGATESTQASNGALKSSGGQSIDVPLFMPTKYGLFDAYPNPFNPMTVIRYQLPEAAHVAVTVYDILGRQVARLVDGHKEAGFYEVTFDASRVGSGVYLYEMSAGNYTAMKKLVVVK